MHKLTGLGKTSHQVLRTPGIIAFTQGVLFFKRKKSYRSGFNGFSGFYGFGNRTRVHPGGTLGALTLELLFNLSLRELVCGQC